MMERPLGDEGGCKVLKRGTESGRGGKKNPVAWGAGVDFVARDQWTAISARPGKHWATLEGTRRGGSRLPSGLPARCEFYFPPPAVGGPGQAASNSQ